MAAELRCLATVRPHDDDNRVMDRPTALTVFAFERVPNYKFAHQ
jgi:hypothetical protein